MRFTSRPLAVATSAICLISTVSASAAPAATTDSSNSTLVPVAHLFDLSKNPCPGSCSDAGPNPANWTAYHHVNRLARCKKPMLLDFAIHGPLDDSKTKVSIRSCTSDDSTYVAGVAAQTGLDQTSCFPAKNTVQVQASLQVAWVDAPKAGNGAEVETAAQQLQGHIAQVESTCVATLSFASYGSASVGLYAGSQIHAQGIDLSVLQQFIDEVRTEGISDTLLVQHCASDNRGADYAIGIVGSTNANSSLPIVQDIVKTWSEGKCVTDFDGSSSLQNITFWAPKLAVDDSKVDTTVVAQQKRALEERATCKTIKVVSGDSCGSLATKCGVTAAAFTTYNPGSTLCSALAIGQSVCCSTGSLPDIRPKTNANGSCATYVVLGGDYCALIAANNGLTTANLETFNAKTWGWGGCGAIQPGTVMCLSTGTPPMPAPVVGYTCGPQVTGTSPPAAGQNLADLNPCPLNACCDIWGQCGVTDEFCTVTKSATGAPGTTGCISNCGTAIVKGAIPASFKKVTYFETYNTERPCLHMDIDNIDKTQYTHVHLAFASITQDFNVDISGIQEQFNSFVALSGIKRVLSFGGWTASTTPNTGEAGQDLAPIFQKQFTNANRNTFITNLVAFVKAHGLDGVDFDWEYPGAHGTPNGSAVDGLNYFVFLYHLKQQLPAGVTVSIAAPASYYFLTGYPIKAMSEILDYIVYMTYDLHGQWDYNSQTDPGCPSVLGNCLRSHVNYTETSTAMAMITKAGAAASKVVIGVSSYGRSFQMSQQGCTGPTCLFTGPDSGATPGKCTGTAGYLADGEIEAIISSGGGKTSYDAASMSDIMVYNNTQWVAYMSNTTKNTRTQLYNSFGFGGTIDWAVDLQGPPV